MRQAIGRALFLAALAFASAKLPADEAAHSTLDGPLSPTEAPASFELEEGLRVELVAAEPMIDSPVAMAFDEGGRLFVVENRGYPSGPGEGRPPVGRIALLEDTDGDGVMDVRRDFADGLTFPNGALPYAGGLIVTCAPEILFLADRDGDGTAEERRVLFTGFATSGSTQLRASHPTLGPDGWVYVAGGLVGGSVTCPERPDAAPVESKRSDFRFRFGDLAFQDAGGGSQFGMTFDDFGRRFICYNRVQVQHVVLPAETLARNPKLAFSETIQNCPAEMLDEPLKGHGAAAQLYPISANVTTADSHAGAFTAACGATVFRGGGLPERYRGGVFSCDPTGDLVHFDRLDPDGATFAARRIEKESEFFRSSDGWCRPVFLANGPDGALYVGDMYRKTIEHPDYLPVEIRKRTDFESGKGMGRIWRVIDDSISAEERRERFRQNVFAKEPTDAQLGVALASPEGWRRDAAHRLLLEREPSAAISEALVELARSSDSPEAVAQALRLLAREDSDGEEDAWIDASLAALRHASAGVQETAIDLLRSRVGDSPSVAAGLTEIDVEASDPRVRFALAIALGDVVRLAPSQAETAIERLATIYAIDGRDRWTRAAVLSGISGYERPFLASLLAARSPERSVALDAWADLGRLVGASVSAADRRDASSSVLVAGSASPIQSAAFLVGMSEALRGEIRAALRDKSGETDAASVLGLVGDPAVERAFDDLLEEAAEIARSAEAPALERATAVRVLGLVPSDRAQETLLALLSPETPSEVQSAAAKSLAGLGDANAAAALLDAKRFAAYSPALREEVLDVALSDPTLAATLLGAFEAKSIPVAAIDATRRKRLTDQGDAALRERAQALFGAVSADRAAVFERLKGAAETPGDAERGRVAFRRECATCHRLDREGFAVGPDLFGIRNQAKSAILLHILAPDHEITPGFAAYQALTTDGRSFAGLLAGESPTSVTLRMPQGKEERLLRNDIEILAASRTSLMPTGFEKSVTEQEFADLLAYLKGEGPAPPAATEVSP